MQQKTNYFLYMLLFLFVSVYTDANAQTQAYPQNYFRSPIDSPIYLSGNFCTLRNDHFHYGIDITTYEKEGMPVLAAADGFVSRVKVWPYGYGKAIYIDHPNGYTTVYAHLSKYNDFIAKAIKDTQYLKESFEVEFFPKPNEWPIKKGEVIAYSGNSGGSSGPHIHFEIRDTKTEEIINPLLFGLDILDTIKPEIKNIALYKFKNGQAELYNIIKADTAENDTIYIPAGVIGLSAIVNDYTTFKRIAFNPYEISLMVDNKKLYECQFERFSFNEQKMVNVHLDYDKYWTTGQRFQKLYIDDGNDLPFVNKGLGRGWFEIIENKSYTASIFARDLKGNYIEHYLTLIGIIDTLPIKKEEYIFQSDYTIYPKKSSSFVEDIFYIKTDESAIFDTTFLSRQLYSCDDCGKVNLSSANNNNPFYKGIEIGLKKPSKIQAANEKLCLMYQNGKGISGYIGGMYANGWVTGKIMRPGIYYVSADVLPPLIKPTNINKKNIVKGGYMNFEIKDKLSGIASYRGTLDGKWVLMDYDAKNDWLTYLFDENTPKGKHIFNIEVTDKKGNKTTWKKSIIIQK